MKKIVMKDEFNRLNQFPSNYTFQTFLVDEQNKVVGIKVKYDKEPVRPRKTRILKVNYTAEHAEQINKTISLYCNTGNTRFSYM